MLLLLYLFDFQGERAVLNGQEIFCSGAVRDLFDDAGSINLVHPISVRAKGLECDSHSK